MLVLREASQAVAGAQEKKSPPLPEEIRQGFPEETALSQDLEDE